MSDPRRYNELKSRQGILIEVSYVPETVSQDGFEYVRATGLMIAIEGRQSVGINRESKATAVIVNRNSEQGQTVTEIPLGNPWSDEQDVMGMSGTPPGTIEMFHVSEDGSPTFWYPQTAVVVDGVWQVDPVQCDPHVPSWQPHNFNFRWLKA